MRTNAAELPSYSELCNILAHEASREIPKRKEYVHYGSFATIIALLQSYNLSSKFFEKPIRFEELKAPTLFNEIISLFDALAINISKSRDDAEKQKLFNALYNYLSESDEPQQADILFVFGSKSTLRTEKAVELYKKGYAPRILISGKGPFYAQGTERPEAEILSEHARSQGVPKDALIVEKKSITIPDNVKRSLNLLEKEGVPHKKVILVNSPFSQRRGWAHFSKMSDDGTTLWRSNTDSFSGQFSKNGWYRNETGTKIILKEFFGLRVSHLLNTS